MKIEVEYVAKFKTTIEMSDNTSDQEVLDACWNLDVPHDDSNHYIPESFHLTSVTVYSTRILEL